MKSRVCGSGGKQTTKIQIGPVYIDIYSGTKDNWNRSIHSNRGISSDSLPFYIESNRNQNTADYYNISLK